MFMLNCELRKVETFNGTKYFINLCFPNGDVQSVQVGSYEYENLKIIELLQEAEQDERQNIQGVN